MIWYKGDVSIEYLLDCENLVKNYGKKKALNNLNLSITKGKIIGLLGPNGAGKTTLIKILASLHNYDSGKITIDGKVPDVETKNIVAYLPDREFLCQTMTIKQTIIFFDKAFSDFNYDKAYSMIKHMNLNTNDKINSLSKGMQEKVNIVLTFSRNAKLFLLDEPLASVDPSTREKIIQIILENFNKESSIILSTHLINDIEKLFDEVVFINNGQVILHDSASALKEKHRKSIEDLFKELI